ncbi:MAG: sensor histidine kinase [Candidatus Hodarchaeales archaeon]|jgi:signal transduction histidine kinase
MNIALALSLVVVTIFYIHQSELLQTRRNYTIVLFFISVFGYYLTNHLYIFYFLSFEETDPFIDFFTATTPMIFIVFTTISLVFFIVLDSEFYSKKILLASVLLSLSIILIIGIGITGYAINRFSTTKDLFPGWVIDFSVNLTILISFLVFCLFSLSCFLRPLYEKIFSSESLIIGYHHHYWILGVGIILLSLGELMQFVDSEMAIFTPQLISIGIIGGLLTLSALIILIISVYSTRRRIKDKALLVIEEQLATRDFFISVVSHELRTPITVIKGYVDTMSHYDVSSEREKIMGAMRRNVSRLELLIDNVFDISKHHQHMFSISRQKYNLANIIEDTVEDMREISEKNYLELSFTKLPEIAQSDTFVCHFDADRISQVIRNLIHNSIKFTPQGGVSVILERNPDNFHISVNDTGIGINAKKFNSIFDAYTTIDTRSINPKMGLGLGLFISKRIIEAHGGKIWAESQKKNKGTQVHIELPIN